MFSVEFQAAGLQALLGPVADQLAADCGFCRRRRKLTGSVFARTLVSAWMTDADARLARLASHGLDCGGVQVSPQAIDQRFSEESATFVRLLLERVLCLAANPTPLPVELLNRFPVVLSDGSQIALPPCLATLWPGCGGGAKPGDGAASLKLSVSFDLTHQRFVQLQLAPGRTNDRALAPPPETLPAGCLWIADLGYFSLGRLAELTRSGRHFLCRPQANVALWHEGQRWTLGQFCRRFGPAAADTARAVRIQLGAQAKRPCWLLLQRLPAEVAAQRRERLLADAAEAGEAASPAALALCDWTLLVTDLPPRELGVAEAQVLYGSRWQIELIFKLWKSWGGLGESRSQNPWRLLTEQYAKLLALVLNHWLYLVCAEPEPDHSKVRVLEAVRDYARPLIAALDHPELLLPLLQLLSRALGAGCRIGPRRDRPATFQRWRGVPRYA